MRKSTSHSLGRTVGSGLAHVQHLMDRAIGWGFRTMREGGDAPTPAKHEPKNRYLRTGLHAGKKLISFLGNAGDAYYEKYEELKRK